MQKTNERTSRNFNKNGEAYLTKRRLVSIARKAGYAASEETMKMQGYNIIAEEGWIIKVFADGTREKIKQLPKVDRPTQMILK